MTDASWFFPAFTVERILSSDEVISYVGSENTSSQTVAHISVSQPAGVSNSFMAALFQHLSQMDIYLDTSTFLPTKLSFAIHPDNDAGADVPAEVHYSNYKAIGSVEVPLHVQEYVNNSLVLDIQFQDVAINSGLTPSDFSVQQ